MRNAALERDDSILPFTFLLSLLVHGVGLLVVLHPIMTAPNVIEVFLPEAVPSSFPTEMNYFLNFSPDQKIYTENRDGIHVATSGDVRVERLRAEPSRVMPLHGTPSPNTLPSVDRVYMGNTNVREIQPAQQAAASGEGPSRNPSYRASIEAPDGPDGIVQQWDRNIVQNAVGNAPNQNPGGVPGAIRSGAASNPATTSGSPSTAPSGYRRGVINIPGAPLTVRPTTPQTGASPDHALFTPSASVGPNVVDDLREEPRAAGEPGDPNGVSRTGQNYGPRRVLFQPLPEYPEWAERDHVQATPKFYVTVGADGKITRVRLSVSSGYSELDRTAATAVARWLYEPRPGINEERQAVVQFKLKR